MGSTGGLKETVFYNLGKEFRDEAETDQRGPSQFSDTDLQSSHHSPSPGVSLVRHCSKEEEAEASIPGHALPISEQVQRG